MSGFCTFIDLNTSPSSSTVLVLLRHVLHNKNPQCSDSLGTRHRRLLQKHLWHAAEAGEPPQYNEMAMAERWPHALALLPARLPTHIQSALCLYIRGLAAVSKRSVHG